jgi:hypothetical protein
VTFVHVASFAVEEFSAGDGREAFLVLHFNNDGDEAVSRVAGLILPGRGHVAAVFARDMAGRLIDAAFALENGARRCACGVGDATQVAVDPSPPSAERLLWLAERLQTTQFAWLWNHQGAVFGDEHDRRSCTDSCHVGCHFVALVEGVRQIAPMVAAYPALVEALKAAVVVMEDGDLDHGPVDDEGCIALQQARAVVAQVEK